MNKNEPLREKKTRTGIKDKNITKNKYLRKIIYKNVQKQYQ